MFERLFRRQAIPYRLRTPGSHERFTSCAVRGSLLSSCWPGLSPKELFTAYLPSVLPAVYALLGGELLQPARL